MLAYADDTTWIARSEEEMRKIINIANEFYDINDIKINSKKSELLVLNQSKKDKENGCIPEIKLGKKKEAVQVKRGKEAIKTSWSIDFRKK